MNVGGVLRMKCLILKIALELNSIANNSKMLNKLRTVRTQLLSGILVIMKSYWN